MGMAAGYAGGNQAIGFATGSSTNTGTGLASIWANAASQNAGPAAARDNSKRLATVNGASSNSGGGKW